MKRRIPAGYLWHCKSQREMLETMERLTLKGYDVKPEGVGYDLRVCGHDSDHKKRRK